MKAFFFLIGFGLMIIGFTYIIVYLNLLTMGFSLSDYLKYIFSHFECLFAIVGLVVDSIIIFSWRQNNDLYL